MNQTISIRGKRVALTGACGFLGLSLARALVNEGASVIELDMFSPTEGKARLAAANADATYFQCDITDESALHEAADQIKEKFTGIDVLINNAAFNPRVEDGGNNGITFENYPIEKWEKELRVNLTGIMLVCRTLYPLMGSGASIINIASIYGVVAPDQRIYPAGFEKPAVYGASKAAVLNITKYLATLWGKNGVRVNAIVFGGFENDQSPEFVKRYSEKTPLGRMAKPEEASGIVIFLASDASSYATGSIVTVDGGFTAW